MMSVRILEELQTVGVAFFSGALITIVYDILRIVRRAVSHNNFWIGVEDFFFWMWTAIWTFSVLYRENDGSLRFYTMLAMGAGMVLYHMTISEPIVVFLGKILKKLLRIVMYPLKLLKIYIIFFGKKLKKLVTRIIMKLKKGEKDGNKNESQ